MSTQSFLQHWLSALIPSTPQMLESVGDLHDVLNQLPCGQILRDGTVFDNNTLTSKPVSGGLMAHSCVINKKLR